MRRLLLLVTLAAGWAAGAQQQDYTDLLRRSAQHEKQALENPQPFQFFEHTQSESGSETRAVIETGEGRVDRVIAANGQPLASGQEKEEQKRLSRLLHDAVALDKEISDQRDDNKRREMMVTALPDAFSIEFSSVERDGRFKFTFKPNPRFSPTNRETQVFKGMQGWLWIDPVAERIVDIQGELFRDVSFGWGILGRLYRGGTFEVIQTQVSPGVWRITTLNVDFKGRILLFKALRILQRQNSSGFEASPPAMNARAALMHLIEHHSSGVGVRAGEKPGSNGSQISGKN